MSETAWSTVRGKSESGAFELSFGYPDESAYASAVDQLVGDEVASGIAAQDPTLWGPAAQDEAGKRLAWVDLPESSKRLVTEISTREVELQKRGVSRVVLCGMGGSSLAPEVICGAAGVELVVLDSSDPDFVRAALEDRLAETVVVVSSKSGGTVETDSQRRAFEKAFRDADIEPAERIVVVTDPGSPLSELAEQAGYRTFLADPDVGGRYSALTAFGLVPSGLAGADVAGLLEQAAEMRAALEVDSVEAPNFSPSTPDEVLGTYGPEPVLGSVRPASGFGVSVDAPLGAQLLLWEYATAVAGRMIGINPFDQPDVESAKAAAREMLDGGASEPVAAFDDGPVTVYASGSWLPEGTDSVEAAVSALLDQLDADHGYVAVQAYLDRHRDASLANVRSTLASRTGRPVTFGWGPRFLHSTGQYHKGGPPTGVYLQVTGQPEADLAVPDRPFTFHEFLTAQAVGDGQVLADQGRPVLRLHVSSPGDLADVQKALA